MEEPSAESIPEVGAKFDLSGDVGVVTGAARGIGRMVAFTLASAGADLVISDIRNDQLDRVASEAERQFNVAVHAVEADVTSESDVVSLVDATESEFGQVDILVNNAGGGGFVNTAEMPTTEWERVIDLNLTSTFLCSKAAFPSLKDGGRVVNVSSIAGVFGATTMSHYGAAKAGVINLTRSLANEWKEHDVRVNAVAPIYPILTPGSATFLDVDNDSVYAREGVDRDVGSPAEVADTVLFLVSQASSFITGETIMLGGLPSQEAIIGYHFDGI